MAIVLPAYCTRGEVRRALDVKSAAWNNAQVDRAIDAARDSVEALCHRRFYPEDTTHQWDWPLGELPEGLPVADLVRPG